MKIGVIDAEIINKKKHRFPNLACMKISSYHKGRGDFVKLLLSYEDIENYDIVYISKVFVKTCIPQEDTSVLKTEKNVEDFYKKNEFLKNKKIRYGGTGFFYENAPMLPYEIEHCKPDYNLYDEWVKKSIENGEPKNEFKYYNDYSIGFLTRGCFRKCEFCVNKKYDKCHIGSPLNEFYDKKKKKICFLDDNFFSYEKWKELIKEVKLTGKRFQFKQGLDERLLTEEKVKEMQEWKYDGDFIFAFDNIEDKGIIESKLDLIYTVNKTWNKQIKFYVFCGFDRNGIYDENFWLRDIKDTFERIKILSKYSCFPYIMRHENYKRSPYSSIYNSIASWCNQPSLFKSFSFSLFCKCKGMTADGYKKYKRNIKSYLENIGKKYSCWINYEKFESQHKELFNEYFDFIPEEISEYGRWVKE